MVWKTLRSSELSNRQDALLLLNRPSGTDGYELDGVHTVGCKSRPPLALGFAEVSAVWKCHLPCTRP